MSTISTSTSRHMKAARANVYRALLDAGAVATWMVPDDEVVVEVMEFETADDSMRGEMTVTFTLTDADGGTDVLAVHDNLPPGLSPADNETGWRMALDKLAALVEAG